MQILWNQYNIFLDQLTFGRSFLHSFSLLPSSTRLEISRLLFPCKKGIQIHPLRVCIASITILLLFLFLGEWILRLFGVQIEYFAIAGGFVIFLMALEMVLDITIFQNDKLEGEIGSGSSIVPLAFPMYAGPGAFTALLAITAEYSIASLCISLLLCMLVLYLVLIGTNWLTKYLGQTALYIIRKFFGIIVLAIACKLMFGNLAAIF